MSHLYVTIKTADLFNEGVVRNFSIVEADLKDIDLIKASLQSGVLKTQDFLINPHECIKGGYLGFDIQEMTLEEKNTIEKFSPKPEDSEMVEGVSLEKIAEYIILNLAKEDFNTDSIDYKKIAKLLSK